MKINKKLTAVLISIMLLLESLCGSNVFAYGGTYPETDAYRNGTVSEPNNPSGGSGVEYSGFKVKNVVWCKPGDVLGVTAWGKQRLSNSDWNNAINWSYLDIFGITNSSASTSYAIVQPYGNTSDNSNPAIDQYSIDAGSGDINVVGSRRGRTLDSTSNYLHCGALFWLQFTRDNAVYGIRSNQYSFNGNWISPQNPYSAWPISTEKIATDGDAPTIDISPNSYSSSGTSINVNLAINDSGCGIEYYKYDVLQNGSVVRSSGNISPSYHSNIPAYPNNSYFVKHDSSELFQNGQYVTKYDPEQTQIPSATNNMTGSVTLSNPGTYQIRVIAVDNLGNTSSRTSGYYTITNNQQQYGSVTAYYKDYSGNNLSSPSTFTDVPLNQLYPCYAKYISGYSYDNYEKYAYPTSSNPNTSVTFYYSQQTPQQQQGSITVYYKDYNGNTLAPADYHTNLNLNQVYTYSAKDITGYTVDSNTKSATPTSSNPNTSITFYYNKTPIPVKKYPPTCSINAPDNVHSGKSFSVTGSGSDPQGESLTYHWTVSSGGSLSNTSGTLTMGTTPITVTLYVTDTDGLSSSTVTKTINPKNNPPVVTLNVPSQVTLGDDLNVIASGSDPDGDNVTYTWSTPDGMQGGPLSNTGGIVYFNNSSDVGKQKTFTITATDQYGASSSATATTTVVAPKPTVSISQSGTLKENRKVSLAEISDGGSKRFPIDNSKIQWSFTDVNGNPINVTNTADSGTIESLDNSTGTSSMNMLFTKPGTYTVKCQVTNVNGDTATDTKTLVIVPDIAPTADFSLQDSNILRDPNNNNLATFTLNDSSYSSDFDSIDKRVWFYAFDSNNNGNDEDDIWYVYENGSWRKFGTYTDVKALVNNPNALNAINSGNLTTVQLTPQNFFNNNSQVQSHVGDYYFKEIVREQFGQATIPSLVTIKDCKTNIK